MALLLTLSLCVLLQLASSHENSPQNTCQDDRSAGRPSSVAEQLVSYLVKELLNQQKGSFVKEANATKEVLTRLVTAVTQMERDRNESKKFLVKMAANGTKLRAAVDALKEAWSPRPAGPGAAIASCVPVLIQQNVDGSAFFNRSWAEFKRGFNGSNGNFWLGNDLLSALTQSGSYKVRFELQARNGSWYWAEYSTFAVGNEATNYTLSVSGFSGNVDHDRFSFNNGMMFTTYDRDNDPWSSPHPSVVAYNNNCALYYGGGWWYNYCSFVRVNTPRSGSSVDFSWGGSSDTLLQTSRMWLTC